MVISYINGLALHNIESAADLEQDSIRVTFIRTALDNASLLIQTQFESEAFGRDFRYTMVRSILARCICPPSLNHCL